eukprot:2149930-Amphidinium_carterae.1
MVWLYYSLKLEEVFRGGLSHTQAESPAIYWQTLRNTLLAARGRSQNPDAAHWCRATEWRKKLNCHHPQLALASVTMIRAHQTMNKSENSCEIRRSQPSS